LVEALRWKPRVEDSARDGFVIQEKEPMIGQEATVWESLEHVYILDYLGYLGWSLGNNPHKDLGGPFTQGLLLFGFTNFMRTLHVAPSSVRRITEKVEGFQTELGKIAIDMGVDIVWIPDDLGMTDGPFLSPQAFRKYIFPSMKSEVEAFKKRGVKVLLHSDGQIMALMDDIVEMGFDGIHPIERKAGMSLELMKAKYGDRLTLIGNVDATDLLPHGTAQQIRRQVLECLQAGAPGGGYILASDHSIHEGVKSANTKIMFEMARKYRKYPVRNRSRHTDSGDA